MIRVIEDTHDYLVVYKPAGMSVHDTTNPEDGNQRRGMISLLREEHNDTQLLPVHRLDKITSGLLLVGKGSSATRELSLLFQQRRVQKYYLAILHRKPSKKQGTIAGDMLKARSGTWRLSTATDNPAVTQFFTYGLGDGSRLAIVKPHTGKTHQIRVAMKSVAAPIVGDTDYGGPAADRVYLHAWQLKLSFNNEPKHWWAPPEEGECFLRGPVRDTIAAVNLPEALPWPTLPPRWMK